MEKENIVFEMNKTESEKARKFAMEHKKCKPLTMGEKFMISFIPTGMGDIVFIRCLICGEGLEVTDMSSKF